MKTEEQGPAKKSWLALETVVIIGLCLKLALTAAFLVLFQDTGHSPFQPDRAFAQEKPQTPPAGQEGNKPAQDPTPGPIRPPADDKGNPPFKTGQTGTNPDALSARELSLKQKEDRLRAKEKALEALERQLQQRMKDIEATRQKLAELVRRQEELVKKQDVQQDARIQHLVSAYKSMRPEAAGKLVDSLEDDVAVEILAAMPGRSAGQILANVNPQKAARLTKAISLRQGQQIPEDDNKPQVTVPKGQVAFPKGPTSPMGQKPGPAPGPGAKPSGFPQPPPGPSGQ